MSTYNILFLGDVVGRPGRYAVQHGLPTLASRYNPLFTIINGENSAGGVGITPDIAEEFLDAGADAITLGNHAFNKREISTISIRNARSFVHLTCPEGYLEPASRRSARTASDWL